MGPFNLHPDNSWEVLDAAWGDLYEVTYVEGKGWSACRIGGDEEISAPTPDELNRGLRADFARRQPPS